MDHDKSEMTSETEEKENASTEAPPKIDDSIYDNSLKTMEPSKHIETLDIQSDDEIEPSQSCLSCNVKNIEVIQDTSKEVESSEAHPLQNPEFNTLTTSEKIVTDKRAAKSHAALDPNESKGEEPDVLKNVKSIVDPDPNKLEGENLERKQTTDDKFISPPSLFLKGPPNSTERSFISTQKYQNKTVLRDVSSVENKTHLGSFKNITSLQNLLKSFKITLSNEHLNTVLSKPTEQIDLNCVYTLENWNLFRTIQFEHHRQDSGVSPISSSSTTTSSAISSKNSGEMADCSSLSSDKSNSSCRISQSQSINILSSQDSALEIFPKTSTQKSPETQGFFTTFGDNGVAGQFKPESPIKTDQKAKAATPKRKRGKKNSGSSSVSESPRKNGPKRKRAKELKAVVENKSEVADNDAAVGAKPPKTTRRKKRQPDPPEIQLEVIKPASDVKRTRRNGETGTKREVYKNESTVSAFNKPGPSHYLDQEGTNRQSTKCLPDSMDHGGKNAMIPGAVILYQKILIALKFGNTIIDGNFDTLLASWAESNNVADFLDVIYVENSLEHKNAYFTHIFKSKTQDEFNEFLESISFVPGMERLLRSMKGSRQYELIILSDDNSYCINHILNSKSLNAVFSDIYTNPSQFESGCLKIKKYEQKENCSNCGNNICPYLAIKNFTEHKINQGYHFNKIIFIGESTEDICPALKLGDHNYIFARTGHGLSKLLREKKTKRVKPKIVNWRNGIDILGNILKYA